MTRDELLLVKAMEECNEIAHRISKALRFGMYEVQPGQPLSNRERIRDEVKDLIVTLRMVHIGLAEEPSGSDIERIMARVESYLKYSESQGVVVQP